MGKAGAKEGVGGWAKFAPSPGALLPVLPILHKEPRQQGMQWGWDNLTSHLPTAHPPPFLYSLSEMPINAAEQLPQLPWAENPISKVILEFLK